MHRTVTQIIEANIEPAEPMATMLEFLRGIDGKRLTKIHRDKLRQLLDDETIYVSHRAGMTHIEWGTYTERREGTGGGSLLVSYATKNVVVDAAWIEEKNICYFEAREDRNEKRRQMLSDGPRIAKIEKAIADYNKAKRALDDVLDTNDFAWPDSINIRKELVEGGDK